MTSLLSGQYYKMDDRDIRMYMGQPAPENDAPEAGDSAMEFMRDQSSYHAHYSNNNREYVGKPFLLRICSRTPMGVASSPF